MVNGARQYIIVFCKVSSGCTSIRYTFSLFNLGSFGRESRICNWCMVSDCCYLFWGGLRILEFVRHKRKMLLITFKGELIFLASL